MAVPGAMVQLLLFVKNVQNVSKTIKCIENITGLWYIIHIINYTISIVLRRWFNMFTYVKLKNFKSLKDVTLNLKETQKKVKKFAAIYGENGCGKTNLVLALDFLKKSIMTKLRDKTWNRLPEYYEYKKINIKKNDFFAEVFDIFADFQELRMIGEKEPTEIEYGFSINNVEGFYYLKFADRILEEKLYYKENQKRNIHFKIQSNDEKIMYELNDKIFRNKKYKVELEEEIDKYWGKHTFLAIMCGEIVAKNEKFIAENISDNFIAVIDEFSQIVVKHDKFSRFSLMETLENRFNIDEGKVNKDSLEIVDKYEKALKIFFTQAYADIKDVFYEKEFTEDEVSYKLYFKKLIANEIRIISCKEESYGTKRILGHLNFILEAMNGATVIIDEIDNGIHDVLMKNIILSLKDEITGQLIITTHNTLLLEALPVKELYLITVDYNGNKEINCITDYNIKIQKNNNVRDLYFKGLFGGIPTGEYVDFEEIKHTLKELEIKEV